MSPTRAATWVLAWLLVVAVGSTLVWAVISRAGEQVVASSDPLGATSRPGTPKTSHPSTSHPSPTHSSPTHSATSPSATGSSGAPAPEQRTWQGVGGRVVAQCEGAAISLVSLLPDDGYAYDVKDNGPEQLEVEFEGREDESGSAAAVTGTCVEGVPVFQAEVEGGGDD